VAQICTKSFVGWAFAPRPHWGAYSAPQTLSWFRGWDPRGKGRRKEEKKEGRGREGGSPGMP